MGGPDDHTYTRVHKNMEYLYRKTQQGDQEVLENIILRMVTSR